MVTAGGNKNSVSSMPDAISIGGVDEGLLENRAAIYVHQAVIMVFQNIGLDLLLKEPSGGRLKAD